MATISPDTNMAGKVPPPILTGPMLALAGLTFTAMSSFYLLFSAAPVHAVSLGGPSRAGLATGALMATTIAGEFAAPRIMMRIGRRAALAAALTAMAAPCLLTFSDRFPLALVSCAARGAGLGVMLVGSYSFAAELAPASRRTEALGLYGLASAIPAILCVPLGPWSLATFGSAATAILAAILAIVGLACVPALPLRAAHAGGDQPRPLPALQRIAWPTTSLAVGAMVTGVTITFLPAAHPELSQGMIMLAMLVQNIFSAGVRWISGRPIDRRGPEAAIIGGVVAAVLGALCLSQSGAPAVIAGMVIVGIAFGVLQSATLAQLLDRVSPSEIDGAGALWNGAYDGGFGVGGLAFGGLATVIGYAASFVVTALGLALIASYFFQRFERANEPKLKSRARRRA